MGGMQPRRLGSKGLTVVEVIRTMLIRMTGIGSTIAAFLAGGAVALGGAAGRRSRSGSASHTALVVDAAAGRDGRQLRRRPPARRRRSCGCRAAPRGAHRRALPGGPGLPRGRRPGPLASDAARTHGRARRCARPTLTGALAGRQPLTGPPAGSRCGLGRPAGGPDTKGMRYVRHLAGVVILAGTLSLGLAQQAAASSANVAALQVALKAVGLYPVAVDGVEGPVHRARACARSSSATACSSTASPGPQTRQRARPPRPPAPGLARHAPAASAAGTWPRSSSCSSAAATSRAASTAGSAAAPTTRSSPSSAPPG